MGPGTREADDREVLVNLAIYDYHAAIDRGESPDSAEWAARHPEIAPELNAYFDDLAGFGLLRPPAPRRPARARRTRWAETVIDEPEPRPHDDDLRPGDVLGDYVLLEKLGEGGQGVVWKASPQHSREIVVALKTLRGPASGDLASVYRLRADARAIARMKHAHIIRTFYFGEDRGRWFFVMELIEGGTVADRIESYKADPRSAAVVMETGRQGDPSRPHPQPGRAPPRPQAGQYPPDPGRRAQGDRLRPVGAVRHDRALGAGSGVGRSRLPGRRGRRLGDVRAGRHRRDAPLHVARDGRRPLVGSLGGLRHLRPRCGPLHHAHRPGAVPGPGRQGDTGPRRRGRSDEPPRAQPEGRSRAERGLPEVPRPCPRPALRVGRRAGERPPSVARPPADPGRRQAVGRARAPLLGASAPAPARPGGRRGRLALAGRIGGLGGRIAGGEREGGRADRQAGRSGTAPDPPRDADPGERPEAPCGLRFVPGPGPGRAAASARSRRSSGPRSRARTCSGSRGGTRSSTSSSSNPTGSCGPTRTPGAPPSARTSRSATTTGPSSTRGTLGRGTTSTSPRRSSR